MAKKTKQPEQVKRTQRPSRKAKATPINNEYKVHGAVTDANGRRLSGAEIIVWQQRIRDRHKLNTGRASKEGNYRISYHPPDDAPGKLLIVVEARSRRLEAPLESPITPAQPDLQIDLHAQ